jgi:hypothetical protein
MLLNLVAGIGMEEIVKRGEEGGTVVEGTNYLYPPISSRQRKDRIFNVVLW